MKIALSILALIALTVCASAQTYSPATALTTTVTAGATSNYTALVDCARQNDIAVQVDMKGNADNGTLSNIVFTFSKSVDGVTFGTDAGSKITWTPAINGTTLVTSVTNLSIGGVGKLRLASIQNTSTNVAITNLVVKFGEKFTRSIR